MTPDKRPNATSGSEYASSDNSYETALVIDHDAKVFHVSSNKRRFVSYLLKFAKTYNLTPDNLPSTSDYSISLSGVPVRLLSKLRLATECQ